MSLQPDDACPPTPSVGTHPPSGNRGSAFWKHTRRLLVAVILVGIAFPFVGVAVLWMDAHRGSKVSTGIALLRSHLVDGAEPSDEKTETQVDARVGRIPLLLGRLVAGATPLPPEAKLALEAVREGEVSIWTGRSKSSSNFATTNLESLDREMETSHWQRVVLVHDGNDFVVVYAEEFASDDREISICVAVLEPGTRVIAGGKLRPSALADLVRVAQSRQGGKLPHFALH